MAKKTKCCFLVSLLLNSQEVKKFYVSQGHIDEFVSLYLGDGYDFLIHDHMEFIQFANPLEWYSHA